VIPDITLPSLLSVDDIGESTRDSALPWDRIRAADFERAPGVERELPLLGRVHEARIRDDADFLALEADRAALERIRGQKTLSLNLETRRQEREALDQQRLARENARRAALGLEPLATLEELDDASQPDAVLTEAAEIAADAYLGSLPAGSAILAQSLPARDRPAL